MADFQGSGMRLRAARLWARYSSAEDLRRLMSVAGASYRAAEQGRRPIPREVLVQSSIELNVTAEFLLGAEPVDRVEQEVLKLAELLASIKLDALDHEAISARLVVVRRSAGFRSASEAAGSKGWSRSTYVAHEGRTKKAHVDRLVVYALEFGVDPRLLLLGQELPAVTEQSWARTSESPSSAHLVPIGPSTWIEHVRSGNSYQLQVIVRQGSNLARTNNIITLPDFMVRRFAEGSVLYALVGAEESALICAYPITSRPSKTAAFDGRRVLRGVSADAAEFGDPTRAAASPGAPIALGDVVGQISFDV